MVYGNGSGPQDRYLAQAKWLDQVVKRRFPVDWRTSEEMVGDQVAAWLVDEDGEQLLSSMVTRLTPALRRMRMLHHWVQMNRTVAGSSDDLCLEIWFGAYLRYQFTIGPFAHERVLLTLDVRTKRFSVENFEVVSEDVLHGFGALCECSDGTRAWLYVPREVWREAYRPHLIDFDKCLPLEDVLPGILDQVVREGIDLQVEFRQTYGFPLKASDVEPWRHRREVG